MIEFTVEGYLEIRLQMIDWLLLNLQGAVEVVIVW